MLPSRELYEINLRLLTKLSGIPYEEFNYIMSLGYEKYLQGIEKYMDKMIKWTNHSPFFLNRYSLNRMLLDLYLFKNSVHLKSKNRLGLVEFRVREDIAYNMSNLVNPIVFDVNIKGDDYIISAIPYGSVYCLGSNWHEWELSYTTLRRSSSMPYREPVVIPLTKNIGKSLFNIADVVPCGDCAACKYTHCGKHEVTPNSTVARCNICNRDECKMVKYYDMLHPVEIIRIIIPMLYNYLNRKVEVKERIRPSPVGVVKYNNTNVDTDRYHPIPGVAIKYEYKDPDTQNHRRGHHKSPCAHFRKGHFRKCSHGNYIRIKDEFIKVDEGTGTFVWVRGSRVNWKKDGVSVGIV